MLLSLGGLPKQLVSLHERISALAGNKNTIRIERNADCPARVEVRIFGRDAAMVVPALTAAF